MISCFLHKGTDFLLTLVRVKCSSGLPVLPKNGFMFKINTIISLNIRRSQLCKDL